MMQKNAWQGSGLPSSDKERGGKVDRDDDVVFIVLVVIIALWFISLVFYVSLESVDTGVTPQRISVAVEEAESLREEIDLAEQTHKEVWGMELPSNRLVLEERRMLSAASREVAEAWELLSWLYEHDVHGDPYELRSGSQEDVLSAAEGHIELAKRYLGIAEKYRLGKWYVLKPTKSPSDESSNKVKE